MAVAAAAKMREMEEQVTSLSANDLRDPIYSSDSDDGMIYPPQVESSHHSDPMTDMAHDIVQAAIQRAVELCEYVNTILLQAIQHVEGQGKDEDTLKSPPVDTTCKERYAQFKSDSSTSSISSHEHTVDKQISPPASDTHEQTEIQHDTTILNHRLKFSHSDSLDESTPTADNFEVTNGFKQMNAQLVIHSVSLEEDTTGTPIIESNQTPTSAPITHQLSDDEEKHNIEVQQNIEEEQGIEEKHEVEEEQNTEVDKQNGITTVPNSNINEQISLSEKDDNVGELLNINGDHIKINVVSSRHDDGSLSPEPSFSKVLISVPPSKSNKKDDTLDGKIFGNFYMLQSDSSGSLSSKSKLVDPDSISLVINQCNDEDMEHSDDELLLGHHPIVDTSSYTDEYLDTASLDSTNFGSQESRDNYIFTRSPVALRHNKESIVRRRNDAGRFDETSPVQEEDKNGFAEFAELFEQTFQMSRSQRERSLSPHSNKIASVFVLEGSHDDEGTKVSEGLHTTL